jgi:hypothetical protein
MEWAGEEHPMTVGRVTITLALIVFGIGHLLHPVVLPGVPLRKEMPTWVPGQMLIGYVTGTALLVAAGSVLLKRKTRTVLTCVAGWLLFLVLVIYGPLLIGALADPDTTAKVVGINYFFDTLMFAGVLLALASATPRAFAARTDPPLHSRWPRTRRQATDRWIASLPSLLILASFDWCL